MALDGPRFSHRNPNPEKSVAIVTGTLFETTNSNRNVSRLPMSKEWKVAKVSMLKYPSIQECHVPAGQNRTKDSKVPVSKGPFNMFFTVVFKRLNMNMRSWTFVAELSSSGLQRQCCQMYECRWDLCPQLLVKAASITTHSMMLRVLCWNLLYIFYKHVCLAIPGKDITSELGCVRWTPEASRRSDLGESTERKFQLVGPAWSCWWCWWQPAGLEGIHHSHSDSMTSLDMIIFAPLRC